MAPEWLVRRGGPQEVEAVLRLEREVAEAPHWSQGEYDAIAAAASVEATVRRCLFVAEKAGAGPGGELLGFSVGSVVRESSTGAGGTTARRGELESVAVAGHARRGGVGRALCSAVLEWCREEGANRVELEVRAASAGASELYRGLGFRTAGRRRSYYNDPVDDALLMHLVIRGDL